MNPRIEKTHLKDAVLISGEKHCDNRGLFMEAYNQSEIGLGNMCQDNIAYSITSVLRGLHIQRNNPQGKLVRCLRGRIFDVIVDLRKDSKTFKMWGAFELDSRSKKALWVPPGFAHGYYSYGSSIVYYKCSTLYDKNSDGGINAMDKDLKITWPSLNPIMSKKDELLPSLSDWLSGE